MPAVGLFAMTAVFARVVRGMLYWASFGTIPERVLDGIFYFMIWIGFNGSLGLIGIANAWLSSFFLGICIGYYYYYYRRRKVAISRSLIILDLEGVLVRQDEETGKIWVRRGTDMFLDYLFTNFDVAVGVPHRNQL